MIYLEQGSCMKIRNQAARGIHIASSSFTLLWQHKQLLLYFAFPALITIIGEIMVYNVAVSHADTAALEALSGSAHEDIVRIITYAPTWLLYSGMLLFLLCSLCIGLFFSACLIHHAMHILQYEQSSIKESIWAVRHKIFPILQWAFVGFLAVLTVQKMQSFIQDEASWTLSLFLACITMVLGISWSLLTLFVLPVITLERKNIFQAVVKSFIILKQYFVVSVSGQLTIALIGLVLLVPLLLPKMIFGLMKPVGLFFILMHLGVVMVHWILGAVNTIFKTIVYDEYMAPERELRWLNYPPF
jgi:hypothetical protein